MMTAPRNNTYGVSLYKLQIGPKHIAICAEIKNPRMIGAPSDKYQKLSIDGMIFPEHRTGSKILMVGTPGDAILQAARKQLAMNCGIKECQLPQFKFA